MHLASLDLWRAWKLVKEKRPKVRPNAGFLVQLENYERRIRGTNSVTILGDTFHARADVPLSMVTSMESDALLEAGHTAHKRKRKKKR